SCHMPVWYKEGKILSCSDAVAKAIEWHLRDEKRVIKISPEKGVKLLKTYRSGEGGIKKPGWEPLSLRGACPECGGPLIFEEGCVKCYCGYSDCG
ncbi:MAG: ribonucleotide-diphosphate reductase subunit alpha, partial [Thermodesulfobacteriota bacterium]